MSVLKILFNSLLIFTILAIIWIRFLYSFFLYLGETISIHGQIHDIGIALLTKGSVQVQWANNQVIDQAYVIKDSWYGFICMLASSRGEPFPKSVALEPTEGYILTRLI